MELAKNIIRLRKQKGQAPVLQHGLPQPAADILRMAGKGAPEPDGKQLDAVYPAAPLLIPVEY